jgi:Cdc6-like AAA superfamily ATPase
MEDDRERLVVILAGYSSNMDDFINTNPGLQSRFSRYIDFPDYSEEELLQIFLQNA